MMRKCRMITTKILTFIGQRYNALLGCYTLPILHTGDCGCCILVGRIVGVPLYLFNTIIII